MHSLNVAILWHLHQPSYWDTGLGKYRYPWAFLHAARHYHAMAYLARLHPEVRLTFNLTPVLLEQLDHYSREDAGDVLLDVLRKPANDLDEEEVRRLLDHVFKLNAATMIDPFPRYRELRGLLAGALAKSRSPRMRPQEVLDLQTLYLLTWCGSPARDEEPIVGLITKERDYTEVDKAQVFGVLRELVRGTVPLFREIQEAGIAELSTTPYYHPILPLVVDCEVARQSRPDVHLEGVDFHYPGDAEWHVTAAAKAFRDRFGFEPIGMWPAEGSVSDEALALLSHQGIQWAATDEAVLARSLGRSPGLVEKHRPYRVGDKILVYFRDRELSDRIGFIYSGWDPVTAADDIIVRLQGIRDGLKGAEGACVTIILDGENPWEYYPDRGVGFLNRLYEELVRTPDIRPVRFRDHLEMARPGGLAHVVPGSWIDANFDTWIGAAEKNHAWKLLSAARKKLAAEAPDAEVPVEFYRAEGSDWFWWLGPGHDTPYEASYENLFRLNLKEGLKKVGIEVPPIFHVATPILPSPIFQHPMHIFTPKIDGRMGSYYEWIAAGFYRASEGSFHRTNRRLARVRFGFDTENLYLRLEGDIEPIRKERDAKIIVEVVRPRPARLVFAGGRLTLVRDGETSASTGRAAIEAVVEILIPLAELGGKVGDMAEFAVAIQVGEETVDRLPQFGSVALQVPPADFGRENWSV
jgi:alpha-amylase/alpha-mannosidase (GH57 family)